MLLLTGCQSGVNNRAAYQLGLNSALSSSELSELDRYSPDHWPTDKPKQLSTDVVSGEAAIALAHHLVQSGAKLYGAYWCPYCQEQADRFGAEAFAMLERIECDAEGIDAQPELCQKDEIQGFPSWEINDQFYPGIQSLEALANYSEYSDTARFRDD